jgi:hypothetical protein
MDSLFNIFYVVRSSVRMASLILTSMSMSFYVPLSGMEFEINSEHGSSGQMTNILSLENINNPQSILDALGELEETFKGSQNPLEEARRFLVFFVNEVNFKYGMKLTLKDVFHFTRENICSMQVSEEEKASMFSAMQLLESDYSKEFDSNIEEQINLYSARICWPWHWKWFGLNKKKEFHKKMSLSINQQDGVDLPSNIYIGAVELFASVLIFVLPIPGAQALSGIVAADGARRIFDGMQQLGDERRSDPNYISPQPPFN